MPESRYAVCLTTPAFVFIIDRNESGTLSVTNDAERVCKALAAEFGDRRIIYRDTSGDWDELVHANGVFVGFRAARELVKQFDVPQ